MDKQATKEAFDLRVRMMIEDIRKWMEERQELRRQILTLHGSRIFIYIDVNEEQKMTTNPYADSDDLAESLWEAELVADRYSRGGLILIRTKDGWRAFLGNLPPESLAQTEKILDINVPSMEKAMTEISRMPDLIKELHRLLFDCRCFDGYRPMKFTEELQDEET